MKVFLKINTGKTILLTVSDTETVKNLKLKVKNKTQIPIEAQRIFHHKTELQDESVISQLQIDKSTILQLYQMIVNY